MHYLTLACDYDGTIAQHGRVDSATVNALERVKLSGRKLLLVTGREIEDLQKVFDRLDLFDLIVGENGALLYTPAEKSFTMLTEPPPAEFVARLKEAGVSPMSVGHAIVATWRPYETLVLAAIQALGLELHVVFNKDAVMVLPSGVNKATGLAAALNRLCMSRHNCVAIGDAENDHAFLSYCEFGAAVDNALPALKERADWVAPSDHGAGVAELIGHLLADDLQSLSTRSRRNHLVLGKAVDVGGAVEIPAQGTSVMICGSSGSGKSTLTSALLERLTERGYQFCIVDPEGDYQNVEGAVLLGDAQRAPSIQEIVDVLSDPGRNAVVNLLGLALDHRPEFLGKLLPRLLDLRTRTGHPHWIILDEAHHMLPRTLQGGAMALYPSLSGVLMITVHPELVVPSLLSLVDMIFVAGKSPGLRLEVFAKLANRTVPAGIADPLNPGEYLVWKWREPGDPILFRAEPPKAERKRHHRKYAEGELDPDRCFYFRGPEGKLNLKAQNLMLFLQIADGVDDGTWLHHLRRADYSHWFREMIKDPDLAGEAAAVEINPDLNPRDSRAKIREAIEKRYTAPAGNSKTEG
jgi:HAD superfamily hydrolase (TIGR01484 family)